MKTFQRHKTYEEIKAQCKEQGLVFNGTCHNALDTDVVCVKRAEGSPDHVVFNLHTGDFWGHNENMFFHSDRRTSPDGTPWFDALLNFFYVKD